MVWIVRAVRRWDSRRGQVAEAEGRRGRAASSRTAIRGRGGHQRGLKQEDRGRGTDPDSRGAGSSVINLGLNRLTIP